MVASKEGLCIQYKQRSDKPLLNYKSNHSKNVFEGIIMGCLRNAVNKSCACKNSISLETQISRLEKAGYPKIKVEEGKRKVLSKKPRREWEVTRVGLAPQIHKLTHQMKKVGKEYNMQIVSTYKNKLQTLPGRIDRMRDREEETCKPHDEKPFPCNINSIYEIGLTCGASYVGETGRCPNVRFAEHIEGKGSTTTVNKHMKKCKCTVSEEDTKLITDKAIRGNYARKIVEAITMEAKYNKIGDKLISAVSINPTSRELEYIAKHCNLPFLQK
jgi:hypothetical protein